MSVYNLIEYGDSFSKTCEILWQYYSDEPNINNEGNNVEFLDDANSAP